jgi:PAS domain S-box-containing protein
MNDRMLRDKEDIEFDVQDAAKLAITKTVWNSIRPVSLALSGLFLFFTIAHLFTLTGNLRLIMVGFAGTTALICFGLSYLVQRMYFSERWTYPIGLFILVLSSSNSLLHFYLTKDIIQTTNLMVVIFGAGYFILSKRWYFISLVIIITGWVIITLSLPNSDGIVHFSIALFTTSLLSTLFNFLRNNSLFTVEKLRLTNEYQRDQLQTNILALEAVQQELERFLDLSIDIFGIVGADGYFSKVNSAISETLGFSKDELISKPFMDLVHPEDRSLTEGIIQKIQTGSTMKFFENRFITKGGGHKWFLWSAAFDTKGEQLYVIGHDITQLKENQLAVEEREKRLNAILSTATDGIIVINESGIIQTFNRGAERIFGYSEREAIGKNVNLLMPAPDSQKHQGYIDAYFHKQKQNSNVVSRINQRGGKRKNGEVFPLSLSVSFVELPDNKLFTGIIRDISEQVRIENELKLAKERLQNELSLAAKIQANLMERTIPKFEHFDLNAVNIPARYLSGDFYDVKALNPNTYQLVLGDLAGKGIPAALLAFSTIFLLKAKSDIEQFPKDLLELLNQTLFSELDRAEVFITLFIAQIDLATNQVNYASAGHGEAFLWRYTEKKIIQLQATGLPVGVDFNETYREKQCNLRPGDLLIIYSDGITEATNSSLDQFGFEQLAEIINTNYHLSASTISDKIIDRVKQFSEGHEQDDDITLLVMKSLPRTIELEIPGKIAILDQVLSTIHEYAANYSIDFANEVELACSEVLTNIIKHSYQSKPGMVQIKIHLILEGIAFDFYDQGESFELDLVSEPNPEDLYESGYGIFIMKQIFDEVLYEFDKESGNHWRLNKLFREK